MRTTIQTSGFAASTPIEDPRLIPWRLVLHPFGLVAQLCQRSQLLSSFMAGIHLAATGLDTITACRIVGSLSMSLSSKPRGFVNRASTSNVPSLASCFTLPFCRAQDVCFNTMPRVSGCKFGWRKWLVWTVDKLSASVRTGASFKCIYIYIWHRPGNPPRDGHGHVCRCIYLYVHRSVCMYVSPFPPVGWGVVVGCMYT